METPESKAQKAPKRWRKDLVFFALLAASFFTARSSLADHYSVPTGSMLPTVHIDDHIFVNKLAYGFHVPVVGGYLFPLGEPQRGDVVVLNSPEDGRVLLKRVAAVPGDTVRVVGGELVINGAPVPVEEGSDGLVERLGAAAHPLALTDGGGPGLGPLTVPEGRYLMLGDNRGNSHDGRMFGLVDRGEILGRADAVFLRDGHLTWIGL